MFEQFVYLIMPFMIIFTDSINLISFINEIIDKGYSTGIYLYSSFSCIH
jgi:hypothetical protein